MKPLCVASAVAYFFAPDAWVAGFLAGVAAVALGLIVYGRK